MPAQNHRQVLEDVRIQLRAELTPVRPLQSERLCLDVTTAFVLVTFAVLVTLFGLRMDREVLGAFWLWGPSVLQILAAMVALVLAMKESLPGRSPSYGALWWAAGAGLLCHVGTTFGVAEQVAVASEGSWSVDLSGFGLELCLGISMLLIAFWIAQRGFTARTGRLGLMLGLGAAFVADAIWRLFCSLTDPAHVFVSHTLAIAVTVAAGWCLTTWWGRRKRPRQPAFAEGGDE